MGDCRPIGELKSIAEMAVGDFVIVGEHELLPPEEVTKLVRRLVDAPVSGVQDWMHEIPRRWFN